MPIRFRCDKCNSKLSIATAKVGTQAECPACHESLTVPAESTVPPKPRPGSSRKPIEQTTDSSREATKRVGERSGKERPKLDLPVFPDETRYPDKVDEAASDENRTDSPLAEKNKVYPEKLRTSTETEPNDDNDPGGDSASVANEASEPAGKQSDGSNREFASGSDSDQSDGDNDAPGRPFDKFAVDKSAVDEFAVDEFAVYDEPILIVDQEQENRVPDRGRIDHDRLAVPRRVVYMQGALLGLSSLLFFSLGWWLGSNGASNSRDTANVECEVVGDIYYESADGRKLDEGAVVMFLPTERRPQTRPNAEQLMPGNVLTSRNDSVQIIRELGGDVGSVSGNGRFTLRLPANQTYYMCVLSARKSGDGDADEALTKQQRAEMGTYFLPVESLVNKQDYHWEKVSLSGTQRTMRDVVF